jgi:HKD family nuclease
LGRILLSDMLWDQTSLASRFEELLSAATAVDVAVAWITSEELTDRILAFVSVPGHTARIVTGVSDYLTNATALRRLHAPGIVKIGVAAKGYRFHPKFYSFKVGERLMCLVGSANLTGHAFGGNIELVHEYEDDGGAAVWFNKRWKVSNAPTQEWLDEYDRRVVQTIPTPQAQLAEMPPPPPPKAPIPGSAISAVDEADPFSSWPAYVAALKRADEFWYEKYNGKFGVLTGENTYLGTIQLAQPLITKDWTELTTPEAYILLGLEPEYGLLGSMKGAGIAKNVFLESSPKNLKTRQAIQNEILSLRKVSLDRGFPIMARRAHEVISNRDGFAAGVATRLLALGRPEVLVSVNNESVRRLSELTGLPETSIRTSQGYQRLIKWIMAGKWWDVTAPSDLFEKEIWSVRAAIIDSLVYRGHFFEAHNRGNSVEVKEPPVK